MASSSSSFHSAPAASSCHSWSYDVFLSFRGEDTRKNFVDHLYSALSERLIDTYKDDEKLPRGESIGPSLLKAIEESQIAVIIFSKNYADSSWCLDELAYIMKCRDEKGQIVLPIFYDVEPTEVRKQKGQFGEGFAKHESENYEKVESWRNALVAVANLAGWEPKYIANGHESKGIKEIVDKISSRLYSEISGVDEKLIGIEARVQDLKLKLQTGSGGVLMIGIWGVGGGGKTTLASSVYGEMSGSFAGCCYVENIRDESSKTGLKKLQEQILCGVLKLDRIVISRVEEGRNMIKRKLCRKNVMIVLDDVDKLEQLQALAGSHDWFGEGSRIIITTRDKHLLNAHKVDVIHDISLLDDGEAIKLFSKHASQGNKVIEDYENFTKKIVAYAGGLPLALKVLGSFLCDKDMNEWRSALARLKEIPDTDIVEILKISFDGLKTVEKELFLDIACFFRRTDTNYATEKLDACGFYPVIGVKVLIQKALITINADRKFDMHDLVQEMGHYIVRGEHPKNPEEHSRVWQVEDVLKICAMDTTKELDNIKAIQMHPMDARLLEVNANMKKLRWIDWTYLPGSSLPANFLTGELCCLLLSSGAQRQLWEGYKYLPNLRIINLYRMDLIKTPDISGLPNLERLVFYYCIHLEDIHTSIGHSERLMLLEIHSCDSIKIFPAITNSKKLETLRISYCPKLIHTRLQLIHKGLRKLHIFGCQLGDDDIDSVVGELSNLQELGLTRNNFSRINFSRLQLPRLKFLNVSYSQNLVELLELPSSIAVLRADLCGPLVSIGDISNCKWLWKVALMHDNPCGIAGHEILQSILQGNAIEDHFISLTLPAVYDIQLEYVNKFVREKIFSLQLPRTNWYDEFCGFLICIVASTYDPFFTIILKPEIGKDFQSDFCEPDHYSATYVGYVSFKWLKRHTQAPWWNSACNTISFSVTDNNKGRNDITFRAALVPKKIKVDSVQTTKVATYYSEFWDEEREDEKTFMIQEDSNSSIKIKWRPRLELPLQ